ncbi:TRAP transporter substrate-binding protein [Nesterenkonia sp. Act20]|uniref:TRAP transporter substrate-binding protein n=1 Tax=Nesterenkonia sp. Act20 TaxID=1483432 RepID=UPI001C48436A|nr:TRAP transporter substrate-binding protein [Nesterenkonia sp. Act20]
MYNSNQHKKHKNLSVAACLTTGALALSGCGFFTGDESEGAEANGDECTTQSLRLATIRADEDPTTLGANAFAEELEEATEGSLTVEVYPNSQLGDANDVYASMAAGEDVDIFYNGISLYPSLEGAEDFTVLTVPFMWESYDQLKAVLDSDRYQELMDEAADATGVRVVATNGDAEPRALSANRAIETADDMEGLALRIAEAPLPQEFATALGANPQVIPFSDLYLSLRQNVVDAQENGAITMVNQSLTEVQSHYMPVDYIRDVQAWQFSDATWGSLCADQQEAVQAAAENAGELVTQEVATQMDDAMATIEDEMEVVDFDRDSFVDALDGTFEQFDGEMWSEGLLEETRELAEENR